MSRTKPEVKVDENHPFDLEAYISSYSGKSRVRRLLHIASCCPSLSAQAYQLAIQTLLTMRDAHAYVHAVAAYNQLPGVMQVDQDQEWIDRVRAENQNQREKLEVELRTYQSNMIKESIRMGHRDLGDFFRAIGDSAQAMKHYTKSREFSTTSQHVLEMCLSVLELLMEQESYNQLQNFVYKAESVIDPGIQNQDAKGAKKKPAAQPGLEDSPIVQSKLQVANALGFLGRGGYEQAARAFLQAGTQLGDWSSMITPGDMAVYASLCSLATLSRSAVKTLVLEDEKFCVYLEQEPYMRDILEAYMNSKFKTVLELLERHSARHLLDIHLWPHVQHLTTRIRRRAIILHFQPYASVQLNRMAETFGIPVVELEKEVIGLIQDGEIAARVDSTAKVLRARNKDQRAALFARALKVGEEAQAQSQKILLRMRL
ncbi:G protein pathway suppressor 1 [Dacryopinax primogenitus]|uniref:G protein pathway suppressor 1 n=1 Tax=Dacryopinax primogenitus (strain DJM 731) TaxID=1858805 RepID=M5GBV9_DACPD|nr:G protein pathway suppressor 1 [Dacryopinax primogenitus]EJU01508.1 G protein pathway suppressor 1 [Dacryopinax primogenitus]